MIKKKGYDVGMSVSWGGKRRVSSRYYNLLILRHQNY